MRQWDTVWCYSCFLFTVDIVKKVDEVGHSVVLQLCFIDCRNFEKGG